MEGVTSSGHTKFLKRDKEHAELQVHDNISSDQVCYTEGIQSEHLVQTSKSQQAFVP